MLVPRNNYYFRSKKVSAAVAAVEEKASQELLIEREKDRTMFDRIKTTTDEQKQEIN